MGARRARDDGGRHRRRLSRGRALPRARAHLLVLAALALVVMAWRCRLDQFALALPHEASVVPGASYADVHVRLPAAPRPRASCCLGGAALCVYAAARGLDPRPDRRGRRPRRRRRHSRRARCRRRSSASTWQPQQLARERPYVADAIAATRRAFALDAVDVRELPDADRLSMPTTSRPTGGRSPTSRSGTPRCCGRCSTTRSRSARYYRFPRLTVDRYDVDGEPRLLAVAARELDRSRLSPGARSWANDRFAYTHGYGVVGRAGGRGGSRRPAALPAARVRRRARSRCDEPRIYYGRQRRPRPAVRDRHAAGAARSTARPPARDAPDVPLRRRGRHPALQPAAPARVRGALRRPQAAAHRDGRPAGRGSCSIATRVTASARWRRSCAGTPMRRRRSSTGACSTCCTATRRAPTTRTRRSCAWDATRVNYARASVQAVGRRVQRPRAALTRSTPPTRSCGPGRSVYPGLFLPAARMPDARARAPALSEAAVQAAGAGLRALPRRTTPRRSGTAPTPGSCRCSSPGRSRTPARSISPTRARASSATSAATTSPRRAGTCVPRTCSRGCPAGRASG